MALRWSHSGSSMNLAVQLPFHEEVAHLFQVDVAVGAHKAAGMMVRVPSFHHRPTAASQTHRNQFTAMISATSSFTAQKYAPTSMDVQNKNNYHLLYILLSS